MNVEHMPEGDNYYTAGQAREKLGMTEATFHLWVRKGKITRRKLPGKSQGRYLKREIDALVKRYDEVTLSDNQSRLQFRQASINDMDAENHLAYLVFGEKANNPATQDARRRFVETNPNISWHLYDNGMLVCSLNFVPLTHDAILQFREGERGWVFGTDKIEQFVSGKPLECIIIDFMTYPSVTLNKRRYYAGVLLHNFSQVIAGWGKKGIEITSIHASGGTPDGRSILENAKFVNLGEKRPGRIIYELDVAKTDLYYLIDYKSALAQYKKQHV